MTPFLRWLPRFGKKSLARRIFLLRILEIKEFAGSRFQLIPSVDICFKNDDAAGGNIGNTQLSKNFGKVSDGRVMEYQGE